MKTFQFNAKGRTELIGRSEFSRAEQKAEAERRSEAEEGSREERDFLIKSGPELMIREVEKSVLFSTKSSTNPIEF